MQFTHRKHFFTDRHTDSEDMTYTDRNFNSRTVTVPVYWTTLGSLSLAKSILYSFKQVDKVYSDPLKVVIKFYG